MSNQVIEKLQQFTQLCQRLQLQLKEDQSAFATHAYQSIHDNNEKKTAILSSIVNEINAITTTLNLNSDLPFLKAQEKYGAQIEKNLQDVFHQTISTLQKQLLMAYEVLTVNSQIVNAQLHQVKYVIDEVHRYETEQTYVYTPYSSKSEK